MNVEWSIIRASKIGESLIRSLEKVVWFYLLHLRACVCVHRTPDIHITILVDFNYFQPTKNTQFIVYVTWSFEWDVRFFDCVVLCRDTGMTCLTYLGLDFLSRLDRRRTMTKVIDSTSLTSSSSRRRFFFLALVNDWETVVKEQEQDERERDEHVEKFKDKSIDLWSHRCENGENDRWSTYVHMTKTTDHCQMFDISSQWRLEMSKVSVFVQSQNKYVAHTFFFFFFHLIIILFLEWSVSMRHRTICVYSKTYYLSDIIDC